MRIVKLLKQRLETVFPYKQKKQIENWDFIMVFDSLGRIDIEAAMNRVQCTNLVQFQLIDNEQKHQTLLLLRFTREVVEQQAHKLKMLKRKKKKSYQLTAGQLDELINQAEHSKQHNQHYSSYLRFLKARLQPGNQTIYEQQKYSVFNIYKKDKYQLDNNGQLFSHEQQLRAKYNFLLGYHESLSRVSQIQDAFLYPYVDIMKHHTFKELVPIHKNSCYRHIILDNVKNYLGADHQTYFQFVSMLQQWLLFPTIIGLLTFFFNVFFGYSADDSPGDFVYGFIIMCWSILFVTRWQQCQQWHMVCQQSGYSQLWPQHQRIVNRGKCWMKESAVTGQIECYIPQGRKIVYYFVSIIVCLTVLGLSLMFMVLSLNARGFILKQHKFLYFQSISNWAASGGIFDANTGWSKIPNLIHVIIINAFDQTVYRPLAKACTRYQRHLNPASHQHSIIIKYFIYEYIITFADLFYIAFVCFDIMGLREQLLSLFFIDIIRRIIAEFLVPKIKSKLRSKKLKYKLQSDKDKMNNQLKRHAILQVSKPDYEAFDDYLEIVTNFGYLVMLSSCFPLAPVLILLAHAVELIQDKYKIIHISKRSLPNKYVGMGSWHSIIVFLCYSAIITNILLFAFSSRQIVSIFPRLFESGKDLLYGNAGVSELLLGAVNSVYDTVADTGFIVQGIVADTLTGTWGDGLVDSATTTVMTQIPQFFNNATTTTPIVANLMKPTTLPAPQHNLQFITILFLIEHVFLLMFICLRNILKGQQSNVDVLLKRREYKRRIKKHLAKDVLALVIGGQKEINVLDDKEIDKTELSIKSIESTCQSSEVGKQLS